MPVIKSAKKKVRQDLKRTETNLKVRQDYKEALKKARTKKSKASQAAAYAALDTAVKKNVIHKNKAARLKSALA